MIRYKDNNYFLVMSYSPFNGMVTLSLLPLDYKTSNNSSVKFTFFPDDVLELKKICIVVSNKLASKENFKYEKEFKYSYNNSICKFIIIHQDNKFGMVINIVNNNLNYTFKTQNINVFLCLNEMVRMWILGVMVFDIMRDFSKKPNGNNTSGNVNNKITQAKNNTEFTIDDMDILDKEINNPETNNNNVQNQKNDSNGVDDFEQFYNSF